MKLIDLTEARNYSMTKDTPVSEVTSPEDAVRYSMWNNKRYPELEKMIATDPYYAVEYAQNVIKGPWQPAVDSIKKYGKTAENGPLAATCYARDVLKKPVPEFESIIATDDFASLYYAQFIKKPFPAGEAAIAADGYCSLGYADLLGKPFPAGEAVIASEPEFAARYALYILHKRFELGEPGILKTKGCESCREYKATFLGKVPTMQESFGFSIFGGEFVFNDIPSTITQQQFTQLMRISYPTVTRDSIDYVAETLWDNRLFPGEAPAPNSSWKEFVREYSTFRSLQELLFEEDDGEDDELE